MGGELWVSLMLGAAIGVIGGAAVAWRMARKLEFHGIRLRDWDEAEWQQENAVARLRKVASHDRA